MYWPIMKVRNLGVENLNSGTGSIVCSFFDDEMYYSDDDNYYSATFPRYDVDQHSESH